MIQKQLLGMGWCSTMSFDGLRYNSRLFVHLADLHDVVVVAEHEGLVGIDLHLDGVLAAFLHIILAVRVLGIGLKVGHTVGEVAVAAADVVRTELEVGHTVVIVVGHTMVVIHIVAVEVIRIMVAVVDHIEVAVIHSLKVIGHITEEEHRQIYMAVVDHVLVVAVRIAIEVAADRIAVVAAGRTTEVIRLKEDIHLEHPFVDSHHIDFVELEVV